MHLSKTTRDAVKWALNALGEQELDNKEVKQSGYPEEFEWLWSNYPERNGGIGSKKEGFSRCKAIIKTGEDWKSLARYMKAYEDHCKRENKIGTSFVLQFTSFFSPKELYKDDYSHKAQQDQEGQKTAQASLIDRANSGELYTVTQDYWVAPNGDKYDCMASYYAGKDPIERAANEPSNT